MKPETTTYRGVRTSNEGASATVDGRNLNLALSLRYVRHSPSGFEWGYDGSGPSQLAFSILLDFTGDKEIAFACYVEFRREFIACFPFEGWELTGERIMRWLMARHAALETARG